MDGPLSRESAVCRRERGIHATFSSLQTSPQTTWKSVVLSGFPTAGEPSLFTSPLPRNRPSCSAFRLEGKPTAAATG